jgi:hypothetical protein
MQTLFAIPDSQSVIVGNIGLGWFIGQCLILFTATIFIAVYLEQIVGFVSKSLDISWVVTFIKQLKFKGESKQAEVDDQKNGQNGPVAPGNFV